MHLNIKSIITQKNIEVNEKQQKLLRSFDSKQFLHIIWFSSFNSGSPSCKEARRSVRRRLPRRAACCAKGR